MKWQGLIIEDFFYGLGGEVGLVDFFDDETGDSFFAKGNKDESAGLEFLIVFVS